MYNALCPWHRGRPSAIAHAGSAEHGPFVPITRQEGIVLQVMFLFFCRDSSEPFHCADQSKFRLQKTFMHAIPVMHRLYT